MIIQPPLSRLYLFRSLATITCRRSRQHVVYRSCPILQHGALLLTTVKLERATVDSLTTGISALGGCGSVSNFDSFLSVDILAKCVVLTVIIGEFDGWVGNWTIGYVNFTAE
jgi:hypothetical protein